MPQFHETGYGRKFFEAQLPQLIKAIEKNATASAVLAESKDVQDREMLEAIRDLTKAVKDISVEFSEFRSEMKEEMKWNRR